MTRGVLPPWRCPHCQYSAPVDSMLPEHIAAEHPDAEEAS